MWKDRAVVLGTKEKEEMPRSSSHMQCAGRTESTHSQSETRVKSGVLRKQSLGRGALSL